MTYYFPNGILRSQSPFGRLAIPILSNIAACAEEIFFLDEVGGDNYKERRSYTVEIHVAHFRRNIIQYIDSGSWHDDQYKYKLASS